MISKSLTDNRIKGPDSGSTQILEEAGTRISHLAPSKANSTGCQYNDKCLISDDKVFSNSNIVYMAECIECPTSIPPTYIGTSGHSLHSRSGTYRKDIFGSKNANSLVKHNKKFHQNSIKDYNRFKFHQTSQHFSTLERILTEAHQIHHHNNIMNSNLEYGQGKWILLNWTKDAT